jgi:hypothetical protein
VQQRVQDMDGERYGEPFQYWPNLERKEELSRLRGDMRV